MGKKGCQEKNVSSLLKKGLEFQLIANITKDIKRKTGTPESKC